MNNVLLAAKGPQDDFVIDDTLPVFPPIVQITDFSIDQKVMQFGNRPFIGQKHRIHINPRTIDGDVLADMHITLTLPQLDVGYTYCDNIGRNIIRSCSLFIDEVLIEEITADWMNIADDIFLSLDEKDIRAHMMNEGYSITTDDFKLNYTKTPHTVDLIIPLDFFFCRKKKPLFPLCAIWRQNVYVEIEFYPQTFFTNAPGTVDLVECPNLIIDTCKLAPEERYGMIRNSHRLRITQVYKEPVTELTSTSDGKFTFTAKYPVSLTTWFFRKKDFENIVDLQYFDNRFQFGYSYTENNILKSRDPFRFIRLYLNNEDITPQIGGITFFKHVQALNYNLTTPHNEIYMHSFGEYPISAGMFIQFSLDDKIALDVRQNYTFNVYHYGYIEIMISNGMVTRV